MEEAKQAKHKTKLRPTARLEDSIPSSTSCIPCKAVTRNLNPNRQLFNCYPKNKTGTISAPLTSSHFFLPFFPEDFPLLPFCDAFVVSLLASGVELAVET